MQPGEHLLRKPSSQGLLSLFSMPETLQLSLLIEEYHYGIAPSSADIATSGELIIPVEKRPANDAAWVIVAEPVAAIVAYAIAEVL